MMAVAAKGCPRNRHPRSGGGDCLRAGDELGEFAEVLSGSRQVEFVAGAARAAQSEPIKLQDAFKMCEQHFDLFALVARGLVGLSLGNVASQVAGAFMD
jgi:hypothetical protein